MHELPKMPTSVGKVAIVGTAPQSKLLAPFDDNSWQIWACSAGNIDQLPRVNIWFELHPIIEMTSAEMKHVALPFYKWLREKSEDKSFDVVMLEAGTALGGKINSFVPRAIPYPRDEMVAIFGRNWFSSSVAYMLALAIARGASEIGLFGVDMAADQEHYEGQRAGCVRFIEIAEQRGIKVHIPPESCLAAAPPMYGYWEGTNFGRRVNAMLSGVKAGMQDAAAREAAARDQKNYFAGSLENLRYMMRTWTDGIDMDADLGALADDYVARANATLAAQRQPAGAGPGTAQAFMPMSEVIGDGTGEPAPQVAEAVAAVGGEDLRSPFGDLEENRQRQPLKIVEEA